MKTLNKHPRLFKKIANTLKKLIQKQIKLVRSKMINVKNNGGNKNNSKTSSNNKIIHNNNNRNKPIANGNNEQTDFSRIISISSFRKIPYDNFILRLIPYDNETYKTKPIDDIKLYDIDGLKSLRDNCFSHFGHLEWFCQYLNK